MTTRKCGRNIELKNKNEIKASTDTFYFQFLNLSKLISCLRMINNNTFPIISVFVI